MPRPYSVEMAGVGVCEVVWEDENLFITIVQMLTADPVVFQL